MKAAATVRLTDGQREALTALLGSDAVPDGDYHMPLWAFSHRDYFAVDGNALSGLVRRGYAERHTDWWASRSWTLTEAGVELARSLCPVIEDPKVRARIVKGWAFSSLTIDDEVAIKRFLASGRTEQLPPRWQREDYTIYEGRS